MTSSVSFKLPFGPRFSLISPAMSWMEAADFHRHFVAGEMPNAVAISVWWPRVGV